MIILTKATGMCISTQRFTHEYRNLGQEVRILSTGKDANYPVPELKINLPFIHSLIEKQGFHFAKPIRKTLKEAVSWADVIQVEPPFLFHGVRQNLLRNKTNL